jgi:phage-related protein
MCVKAPYRVYFYRTAKGQCQACDYARNMNLHHQAKAKRWFKALAELGPALPTEYGKPLRDGIWELRVIAQRHHHRFLYSFWNRSILVTHAFLKKSWQVPETEIEHSRKATADWITRKGWEDIDAKKKRKRLSQ